MLFEDFDSTLKVAGKNFFKQRVPEYIVSNLNPAFELREYQNEAIGRLVYYFSEYEGKNWPIQLLYHMATGSGKTLIMAAVILYLYEQGYRNFIFFVNSTNIIQKTKDNFLNPLSSKYLFAAKVVLTGRQIKIKEVENFEAVNQDDINILFSTVQGLHSKLNTPRENSITYEDFEGQRIVLISDEAHHINTLTKALHKQALNRDEAEEITSWEGTVSRLFQANAENIMLEFTATAGLDDAAIKKKYDDKVIFQYSLKEFRQDRFSKDVEVLQADLEPMERTLQAVVLSQYRLKVAERNGIQLKPVVLMKSKTIVESQAFEGLFRDTIKNLKVPDLQKVKPHTGNGALKKAFDYFRQERITLSNLVREIKEDFAENKCLSVNSKDDSEEKQLIVNSLEDYRNPYRAIFAVDMLNEGWDVLNLFDIVRLYETRDSKSGNPGPTTIREAQLIGRGARYFPFTVKGQQQDRFTRKFDDNLDNALRIIEELHYHSSHNPRYISELKRALVQTGIIAEDERTVVRNLFVKDDFKKANFWEVGKIYLNEQKKYDRSGLFGLADIGVRQQQYKYTIKTGQMQEIAILEDTGEKPAYKNGTQVTYKLIDFGCSLIRKALQKNDFYQFSNLKTYFPKLNSISEFIANDKNLGQVEVEVRGSQEQIQNLDPNQKLAIASNVLHGIKRQVIDSSVEYIGTKTFKPEFISVIVKNKTLKIVLDESSDREVGRPMSEPKNKELFLDLKKRGWYIYEENFGTSEEKFFVKFIESIYGKLKKEFADIYLLRNAKLFQLYRFSDGKAFEPDFVLFLRKKREKTYIVYQIFVEPKGQHLMVQEKWKEEFLMEIEKEHKLGKLFENEAFKLFGMPFYNEGKTKKAFRDKLDGILAMRT
jgi:type III restriction enzyme